MCFRFAIGFIGVLSLLSVDIAVAGKVGQVDDGQPVSELVVLQPGEGFQAPTPAPERIGERPGSDATAIARWDVVPFQTFNNEFSVGVVAFHINRIDRVEFSVNDGPWTPVRSMSRNPQTGVVEYSAALHGNLFKNDGPIEIRAIAYPVTGVPRLLEPLQLNVNRKQTLPTLERFVATDGDDNTGDGSELNPFKTIRRAAMSIQSESGVKCADNGTIFLMAGDHEYAVEGKGSTPETRNAFLTIRSAPGLKRDQVRITGGGRLDTRLIRLQDLTIYGARLSSTRKTEGTIWFDGCILTSRSIEEDVSFAPRSQWTGGIYATNTEILNVRTGLSGALILRDVLVRNTMSDAISNARLVVNCTVDGIDKGDTDEHPDVLQWYIKSPLDNVIVYGLTAVNARAQGIFVSGNALVTNMALVNVLIEMDANTYMNQWHSEVDHLLLWQSSLVNRPMIFRQEKVRNLSVRDSMFFELKGIDPQQAKQAAINNHFVQGDALGVNFTMGDPIWADPINKDYSPAPGSPLLSRVDDPLVPSDARGAVMQTPASVGAIQPRLEENFQSSMPVPSATP
jgi:hypothetical protein